MPDTELWLPMWVLTHIHTHTRAHTCNTGHPGLRTWWLCSSLYAPLCTKSANVKNLREKVFTLLIVLEVSDHDGGKGLSNRAAHIMVGRKESGTLTRHFAPRHAILPPEQLPPIWFHCPPFSHFLVIHSNVESVSRVNLLLAQSPDDVIISGTALTGAHRGGLYTYVYEPSVDDCHCLFSLCHHSFHKLFRVRDSFFHLHLSYRGFPFAYDMYVLFL